VSGIKALYGLLVPSNFPYVCHYFKGKKISSIKIVYGDEPSVAYADLGSGTFFTPGCGIKKNQDPG
jgi:hypothetical protein